MRSLIALAALTVGCGPAALPQYHVTRGIRYGPHAENLMDRYRPVGSGSGPRPVVLAIHGGAWRGGSRADFGDNAARKFCPLGYDVVSVSYRLAPAHRWPAQIEDVAAAAAFLGASGVDARRIGAFGVSAGGHLASMLHLRYPGLVACSASAAGEGDLRVYGSEPTMADEDSILGDVLGARARDPAALADISPASFARADADVLLIHAVGDGNVYVAQSDRLHAALRAAGAAPEYARVSGSEHGDVWESAGRWAALRRFFDARLCPREPRGPSPAVARLFDALPR